MKTCFVCATSLQPEEGACSGCGTGTASLTEIMRATMRHRFLFGRARVEKPDPDVPVASPKPRAARPPVRQTRPRKPVEAPPPVREQEIFSDDDPVLHIDRRAPRKGFAKLVALLPIVLITDLVLVFVLDLIVLQTVLWLSRRDLIPLINQSLIPLFFVLLTFTVLYFTLFRLVFNRTLGEIVVATLRARLKTSGRG